MDTENVLLGLLESLNNKSSLDEVVGAFEKIIKFAEETRNLTEEEVKQINSSFSDLSQELKKTNSEEWKKIKDQIIALKSQVRDGRDGTNGFDGRDGVDGKDGKNGRDGRDGKDGSPDSPDDVVTKVNISKRLIRADKIEGLADIERIAKTNQLPATTSFFQGLRGKNLIIVGGTAYQKGDTIYITPATSSGTGYTKETPSGTVDSSNVTFTVTSVPVYVVSDGATYFDGAGYTISGLTLTLTVPPIDFIRSFY